MRPRFTERATQSLRRRTQSPVTRPQRRALGQDNGGQQVQVQVADASSLLPMVLDKRERVVELGHDGCEQVLLQFQNGLASR
jgi:hypothetical protein